MVSETFISQTVPIDSSDDYSDASLVSSTFFTSNSLNKVTECNIAYPRSAGLNSAGRPEPSTSKDGMPQETWVPRGCENAY